MRDKLENLSLVEIEIPAKELADVMNKAIKRGQKVVQKRKAMSRFIKAVACAALVICTAFTVGVNSVPVFAESLKDIAGLAAIVRVLQFDKNKGSGGEVTDGQDVGDIKWAKTSEGEAVSIHLFAADVPALVPGFFEAVKEDYPYRLVLRLEGVRSFSAADFKVPAESMLLEAIYTLVTLDDSSQRLVLAFKKAVELEVVETRDPAGIHVNIKEATPAETLPPVYSLRSASFEAGETVGVMEEMLKWEFGGKGVRMLQDGAGTFFVEEGYYLTKEEAMARKEFLQKDLDFVLFLEKMEAFDLPRYIKP